MTKSRRLITTFLLGVLLFTSCSPVEATPDTMEVQNKINAAVAQTLAALRTQVADVQKTEEVKPTETAEPTPTKEAHS